MKLHMGHEFLLLYLDDTTGRGGVSGLHFQFGYMGAVLAHWMMEGRLVSAKAGEFVLRDRDVEQRSLQVAVECVPEKPTSLSGLVKALAGWQPRNRYQVAIDELVMVGLLEESRDTVFGFTWRTRYPEKDGSVEAALIARLREHLRSTSSTEVGSYDDALLSVLRASKLLDAVWPKDDVLLLKERIDARTAKAPIGKDIAQVIRAAEAAAASAAIM